jgi:hypothetical protein
MSKFALTGLAAALAAFAAAEAFAASSKISNVVITDKPKAETPEAIAVAADAAAKYALMQWKQLGNGNRVALVKRSVGAAESFTRMEFSCANRAFRPLGQGKTVEAASKPAPAVAFAPLVADTVSGQVGAFVCKKK